MGSGNSYAIEGGYSREWQLLPVRVARVEVGNCYVLVWGLLYIGVARVGLASAMKIRVGNFYLTRVALVNGGKCPHTG